MIRNKHKLLHSIASVQTSLIYNTGKTDWFFCHIFTFIIASFWNYHFCQQVPPGKKQLYDSCTASLASNSGQRHQVITTRCQFHQSSTHSFCACRFRKGKKTQLSHWYLFTLSGSASIKDVECWWNWPLIVDHGPLNHCKREVSGYFLDLSLIIRW